MAPFCVCSANYQSSKTNFKGFSKQKNILMRQLGGKFVQVAPPLRSGTLCLVLTCMAEFLQGQIRNMLGHATV